MKSRIIYSSALPKTQEFPPETVLLYDSVLAKNPGFRTWQRGFRYSLALKSGEQLKTLAGLDQVLKKIAALHVPQSTALTFVAAGGGSVGDFTGFLASVFLRGRRLVLIPSTWLSAVDSSHGGKNGLNFLKTKNQIGSFYPAERIYVCNQLLRTQPTERLREAMGEVIKIAVLADAKLFGELEKSPLNATALLKYLPRLISLKYRIVAKDPYEKNGTRRLLNLGHTLGHAFESHYGWPHGVAVLMGMQFAARWSLHLGLLPESDFVRLSMCIDSLELPQNLNAALQNLPAKKLATLLCKDKKLTAADRLDFILIKRIGLCVRRSVSLQQVLDEVKRQKAEY